MSSRSNLERMLLLDEGFSLTPYLDSEGYWTIGIGHFIGQRIDQFAISERVAFTMLDEDIGKAVRIAVSIFGKDCVNSWDSARRDAIISLVFNMGEGGPRRGFRSFTKMIAAIKANDWNLAADELRDSKWVRQVDPRQRFDKGRDDRLIHALRTGEYHKEYGFQDGGKDA